ncbi:MAG: hypothetical protein QY332_16785 [Anaerolineales bacterium]|nr:MAG: hypothetical protein QY332_16785 [Anaerolineales bacterium]
MTIPTPSTGFGQAQPASSGHGVFWGVMAAVIGYATALALEQQKKRQDEEAAQIAQVRAEVEARNAAVEANRIAMREQWKIRSWLQGQAILKAQLEALKEEGAQDDDLRIQALKEKAAAQGFGAVQEDVETLYNTLVMEKAEQAVKEQVLQDFLAQERDTSAAEAWLAEQQAQELQAGLMAYYLGRKEGEEGAQSQADKPWWVPIFTMEKANQLLSIIPSLGLGSPKRNEIPIFTISLPGKLFSVGTVSTWSPATDGNPNVRVNPNSTSVSSAYQNISTSISWDSVNNVLVAGVRVASPVNVNEGDINAGLGYSVSARLEVNQLYNTSIGMDINYVDLSIKGDGGKGNLTDGAYVKINVWIVPVAILAFVLWPKLIPFAPGIAPVLEKLKLQPSY